MIALEINKVENPSARGELIDKAMNMSVTAVKQAVREEIKTEMPPSKPPVWEPVAKFRAFVLNSNMRYYNYTVVNSYSNHNIK